MNYLVSQREIFRLIGEQWQQNDNTIYVLIIGITISD